MKEIVVISGKGGTGKTSLVASLAALSETPVLADCDVDAADLHLVLVPRSRHTEDFSGSKSARYSDKCSNCGKCLNFAGLRQLLKTTANNRFSVDPSPVKGAASVAVSV